MSDPRTRIVEQGYDVIGDMFADRRDRIVGDPRRQSANELVSRLSDGDRVLELGCGAVVPDTQALAERFRVTGVDISSEQTRRAREKSWTGKWLGTTIFFSSFPPETNRRLLREAGFELVLDEVVTFLEPEPDGEATFQWVLARR